MEGRAALLIALAVTAADAGEITRSRAEVAAFRASHACPSTAKHRGPCHGFQVDHIRPLCAGGEDAPHNMQWISVEDHRWKTFIDARECRKLRRNAARPAVEHYVDE